VQDLKEEEIRRIVRKSYAKIAKESPCCSNSEIDEQKGYTAEDLSSVPRGADFSLGCGNPIALASLKEGETVLDLGSGGGLDCFLAAQKVGRKGKVIGVDMTPEMLDKARENSRRGHYENVEFRLGEIENLPVADNTADIVISNCVINLSPDKARVFKEAFRVLKPKGRLMISDIVLLKPLPDIIKKNAQAYVECISGALLKTEYLKLIEEAGFQNVKVAEETHFPANFVVDDPSTQKIMKEQHISSENARKHAQAIASIKVTGSKPM